MSRNFSELSADHRITMHFRFKTAATSLRTSMLTSALREPGVCAFVHMSMYTEMCASKVICVRSEVCACIHNCWCACTSAQIICMSRDVFICVQTGAYTYTCVCAYAYVHKCVHAHNCHLRRDHTIVHPMEVKVLHSVRFELVHSSSGSHVSAQQHHRH